MPQSHDYKVCSLGLLRYLLRRIARIAMLCVNAQIDNFHSTNSTPVVLNKSTTLPNILESNESHGSGGK